MQKKKMNLMYYLLAVAVLTGTLLATANEEVLVGICSLAIVIIGFGFITAIVTWIIIGLVQSLK